MNYHYVFLVVLLFLNRHSLDVEVHAFLFQHFLVIKVETLLSKTKNLWLEKDLYLSAQSFLKNAPPKKTPNCITDHQIKRCRLALLYHFHTIHTFWRHATCRQTNECLRFVHSPTPTISPVGTPPSMLTSSLTSPASSSSSSSDSGRSNLLCPDDVAANGRVGWNENPLTVSKTQ